MHDGDADVEDNSGSVEKIDGVKKGKATATVDPTKVAEDTGGEKSATLANEVGRHDDEDEDAKKLRVTFIEDPDSTKKREVVEAEVTGEDTVGEEMIGREMILAKRQKRL